MYGIPNVLFSSRCIFSHRNFKNKLKSVLIENVHFLGCCSSRFRLNYIQFIRGYSLGELCSLRQKLEPFQRCRSSPLSSLPWEENQKIQIQIFLFFQSGYVILYWKPSAFDRYFPCSNLSIHILHVIFSGHCTSQLRLNFDSLL